MIVAIGSENRRCVGRSEFSPGNENPADRRCAGEGIDRHPRLVGEVIVVFGLERERDEGDEAAGFVLERAELAEDGSFFYVRSHAPDETLAVVSRSHPLWAVRAPDVGRGQTIELRFPDAAPSRTFDVDAPYADPRYSRFVGLIVGGLRIPLGAVQSHQGLRRQPWLVRGAGPLAIRDIAETGAIDVILGPVTEEVASRVRDPFALPRYADAPKKRLESGAPRVVLGP